MRLTLIDRKNQLWTISYNCVAAAAAASNDIGVCEHGPLGLMSVGRLATGKDSEVGGDHHTLTANDVLVIYDYYPFLYVCVHFCWLRNCEADVKDDIQLADCHIAAGDSCRFTV
jgi:hypothetical protein